MEITVLSELYDTATDLSAKGQCWQVYKDLLLTFRGETVSTCKNQDKNFTWAADLSHIASNYILCFKPFLQWYWWNQSSDSLTLINFFGK